MIATGNKKNYPVFNAGDDIPIGEKFVMGDDRLTVLEVCPADPSKLNGGRLIGGRLIGMAYYCSKCIFTGRCFLNGVSVHPKCDDFDRSDHQFVYFQKVKDLRK